MCTLGARPNVIDVLTILHHSLNFDEAESVHHLNNNIELRLVSYGALKETKLYSRRPKDLWDISQLEKLRTGKK